MSEPTKPPRPRQLVMACLFIGLASLLMLTQIAYVLSSWTSLEIQEPLAEQLDSRLLRDAGIDPSQAITILRVFLYALLPVSIAGVVFAIYAYLGHAASRIGLSLWCGFGFFVFALAGLQGIFIATFMIVALFWLWNVETRTWFAQVNGKPLPPQRRVPTPTGPPVPTSAPSGSAPLPQDDPFAPAPAVPANVGTSPAPIPLAGPETATTPESSRPTSRPGAVTAAAAVTIISSVLVIVAAIIALLVVTIGREAYAQGLRESRFTQDVLTELGWSTDMVITAILASSIAWLVLAVIGVLGGGLLLTRWRGALVLARVLSAITIGVCLLFLPLSLPIMLAAIAVLVLTLRPAAVAWFTRS